MPKKIIIFSSDGGGGHKSASKTLKEGLDENYDVKIVNLTKEVLFPIDPFTKTTNGKLSGEDFYNFCISNNLTRVLNQLCKFGLKASKAQKKFEKKLLGDYINQENPDLIISVIPIFNHIIIDVAKDRDIPFIVIPTDLNAETFVNELSKVKYEKFKLVLPFNLVNINKKIHYAKIPKRQIQYLGFPVNQKFLKKGDSNLLKKDHFVPEHKFVVMIFMGGQGSKKMLFYVNEIAKLDLQLHLLICLGRKESLRKQISKVKFSHNISYSVYGYTDKVHDLMSMTDLLITKTGSLSVMEGFYLNIPTLADNIGEPLFWEKFNSNFIKKNHFGDAITNVKQVGKVIEKFYHDRDYYHAIKSNLEKFSKKNFLQGVKPLVKEMIELPREVKEIVVEPVVEKEMLLSMNRILRQAKKFTNIYGASKQLTKKVKNMVRK